MPITERIIIPVQGGQEAWKEALKFQLQVLKTQEGYVRTRWGPHSENENNLELFVGWESEEAQKKFQASADFASAMSHMEPHLRSGEKPVAYFVKFTPHAPKEIIDAALVQVVTVTSSEPEDKIRAAFEKLVPIEGCTGVAGGYSTSDVGGKGKVFVGIMGWSTLEASAKGSHAVKLDFAGEVEEHHVNFRYPIKGFRGL